MRGEEDVLDTTRGLCAISALMARYSTVLSRPTIALAIALFSVSLSTRKASAVQQGSSDSGAKAPPVLTQAADIRQLTFDKAKQGYPVHVRAVVTYYDPKSDLFVQDSSAGIWVEMGGATAALKIGDFIDLQGVSSFADFAPQIAQPRITVLGTAPLPSATPAPYERLASGAEDSQWVEVEGIVHQAFNDGIHLSMGVAMAGGRITVRMPNFTGNASALVDAKVRLLGACGAIFNSRGQITGVILDVPSPAQMTIEEPGLPDPFFLPVRPISTLLSFAPNGISGHRVRVQGVVTSQTPSKSLFIQDETEGLYLESVQNASVKPGDVVDVVGFPSPGDYSPILQDALFRRLGSTREPKPISVNGDKVMSGDVDAEVIQIDAWLKDKVRLANETDLILQSGNIVFDAQALGAADAKGVQNLESGSLLRLTGVCSIKVDEGRVPRAFRLVLRSPRDVQVLQAPPWLTASRAATVAGMLLLATLMALLGMAVLRRRVEERTEALKRRTIELERSNAELEQFANVASHDLQEPLRMVSIFAQLLSDRYKGNLDSDADAFLGFLLEGAQRMRTLIDGLLSFSRVQSGARELRPTDSEEVLLAALADLTVARHDSEAEITHDPLPTVMADASQMEQVFQNIIGNAIKFAGGARPRIHVSADRVGSQWIFSIRDDGIGIDPRFHDKIFGIFQRLHSRDAYPGTGIGLSICKRIVERHGGRIWVESGEGQGSTFYFSVPAAPAEIGEPHAERPSSLTEEPQFEMER